MINRVKSQIFFIILLTFCALSISSCDFREKEQSYTSSGKEKVVQETQEGVNIDSGSSSVAKTPLNTTIYNSKKDLWGWYSGDYIVLKWNLEKYSFFRIYRKSGSATDWEPAYPEKISKNEFFDSDVRGYGNLEYKVEAVGEGGEVLYTYEPLVFYMGS